VTSLDRSASEHSDFALDSHPDAPPAGERWSSWDGATHGPTPRPDWVITDLGAVEADLGVLKTGKEADVHLIRRWVPDTAVGMPIRESFMAAKRFRAAEHRLFHRDAGYIEGRRVRRSREMRAMATRTAFGDVQVLDHPTVDVTTPLPSARPSSKAAIRPRAFSTSASLGAHTSLQMSTWPGWMSVLPSKPISKPCTHSTRNHRGPSRR
jgi:hypothetical protein